MRSLVVLVVLFAVGRHFWKLYGEWSENGPSLADLRLHDFWMSLCPVTSAFGRVCSGCFWVCLLRQLGVHAPSGSLLRAYAIGTLGKYMPGKVLVVVLRTTLTPAHGTSRLHLAFTVFYETLAGMGSGAIIGCACMVLVQPKPGGLVIAGGGAGAAMLTVLHPAFFGRLVGLALRPFRGRTAPAVARLPAFPFARGPAWLLGGWLLNGLSLLAALHGMGVADVGVNDLTLMTGASTL